MNRLALLTALAVIGLPIVAHANSEDDSRQNDRRDRSSQQSDRPDCARCEGIAWADRHPNRPKQNNGWHSTQEYRDRLARDRELCETPEPTPEPTPTPQAEAAPSFEETSNYENGADKDHFGPTLSAHAPGDPELAAHGLSPYNDWNINAMLSNHALEKSQVVYTCEGGCLRVLPETRRTFTQWHHVGPDTITSLFDRVHEVIFHEPR